MVDIPSCLSSPSMFLHVATMAKDLEIPGGLIPLVPITMMDLEPMLLSVVAADLATADFLAMLFRGSR